MVRDDHGWGAMEEGPCMGDRGWFLCVGFRVSVPAGSGVLVPVCWSRVMVPVYVVPVVVPVCHPTCSAAPLVHSTEVLTNMRGHKTEQREGPQN